jgi:hypothetical protein
MQKKTIAIAFATISLLSVGSAAQAGILEQLLDSKLVASIVPAELKQAVQSISSGKALGIDSVAGVFRPTDETDNIDENQWSELEASALKASNDSAIKETGVTLGTVNGIMQNTTLGGIDAVNNNKIRQQAKSIQDERQSAVQLIKENSVNSESTLEATDKLVKVEALKARNQLTELDLRSRQLTSDQIRNANDLRKRQDELAEQKNQEIGLKAQRITLDKLTTALTRPSYEMPQ